MDNNKWARVQKVHEYCDICKRRKHCTVWCYGEQFQQDDGVIVKRSLISRFLSWLKGGDNVDSKS